MKRADATDVPSALTFIKVSNSGRKDTLFPPMLIAITQVPVDTTLKGAGLCKRYGNREALESWIPHTTGVVSANPVRNATSGRIGPKTSAGRRGGAILCAMPRRSTSDENVCSAGFHKSVWLPREVTSVVAIPVSR